MEQVPEKYLCGKKAIQPFYGLMMGFSGLQKFSNILVRNLVLNTTT